MNTFHAIRFLSLILGISICSACSTGTGPDDRGKQITSETAYVSETPTEFEIDPFWPKPLPDPWILGEVSGVAIDANDHVWIVHRPGSLTERETAATLTPVASECCIPAPSVIEFDTEGNVLQAWGNQDTTQRWPESEHGIFVDAEGNVWIAGNSENDHVVLKFSNDGKLLLQIGEWGITKGSNDTRHLGGPTDIAVDLLDNEVYISDGYVNRRIIVFDATTGDYKRHWGAYGEAPDDAELPAYDPEEPPIRSFRNPMHAVRISHDNLVYTADRINNRVQVFQKDGSFIRESFIAGQTLMAGTAWDIEFSPDADQTYLYIPDGMNRKIWILDRQKMEVIGSFGKGGRYAGQFGWVHSVAMDSNGNLYTSEVIPGKRIQKFRPVSGSSTD